MLCFLALPGLPAAPAAEPQDASPSQRIHFAVPEFESNITLAVYDSQENLIRVLFEQEPEGAFHAGLDGLLAEWDGKDDAGREAAPGKYFLRGYAVGDLGAEGIAYAGNDWVSEFGENLPLASLHDFAGGSEGVFVALGSLDDGRAVLFSYDAKEGVLRWKKILDAPGESRIWVLASRAAEWIALANDQEVLLLEPKKGVVSARAAVPFPIESLALAGEELVVTGNEKDAHLSIPTLAPVSSTDKIPPPLSGISAADGRIVGYDKEGICWVKSNDGWVELFPGHPLRFRDIAASDQNTFWAVVEGGEEGETTRRRVGEFDTSGEFLRQIAPETFEGNPEQVAAAGQNVLFVFTREGVRRVLTGIRKSQADSAVPARWEIFFQKTLDATATALPKNFRRLPVKMEVSMGSSMNLRRETFQLHLSVSPPDSISLTTREGIRVANVLQTGPIQEAGASLGDPDKKGLRLWITSRGRGEEFSIPHIDRIVPLDLGEISWPPEAH